MNYSFLALTKLFKIVKSRKETFSSHYPIPSAERSLVNPIPLSDVKYPITLWVDIKKDFFSNKEDATKFFSMLHHELDLIKFEMETEKDQADDHWDTNVSIKSENALFTFIHWLWPETRSIEAEMDKDELWICPVDDENFHVVEMNCI